MFRLYDSRTKNAEPVAPARRRGLRVYTCGPTVYRFSHVGNLRSYLLSDLIRRNAERHRLSVEVGQSITDVGQLVDDGETDPSGEDTVAAQARAEGRAPLETARFYEDAFRADCAALNFRPPEYSPRASESIGLMIDLIDRLIQAGHAYGTDDGSVYFDARTFAGYGELSGNLLTALRPGHRLTGGVAGSKRFHADWALWKGARRKDAMAGRELTWPAPWGEGFPGWHTECSAMSLHYLGDVIDIHTGGIDLRFPHHENERAQSDSVAGHEVVRHWVHGEHLLFEGRKMARSTGNVVLLADLAERGMDPLALRLAFLEHRYRQQLNLTWQTLADADAALRAWRAQVAQWATHPSRPMSAPSVTEMADAFDNDLDTPAAVRSLRALARSTQVPPGAKFETFAHIDQLFGLDLARDVGRAPDRRPLPAGADQQLQQRATAREQKDWPTADRLREALASLGVTVTDTPAGQHWTVDRGH